MGNGQSTRTRPELGFSWPSTRFKLDTVWVLERPRRNLFVFFWATAKSVHPWLGSSCENKRRRNKKRRKTKTQLSLHVHTNVIYVSRMWVPPSGRTQAFAARYSRGAVEAPTSSSVRALNDVNIILLVYVCVWGVYTYIYIYIYGTPPMDPGLVCLTCICPVILFLLLLLGFCVKIRGCNMYI